MATKTAAKMPGQVQEKQPFRLNIDDDLMSRAIQAGNPSRLKNVLKKVLRGEDINLLVIGGSNSAGGKLGLEENSLDGLYFKVFAKWWNNTFGTATKSFVKEIQLSIGGTGSTFFDFFYKTFLAEGEKIDLVLIEVSINEVPDVIMNESADELPMAEPLEQLTRQVLTYPSAPAVLYINMITGNPSCRNLENFGQTEVARHYEITSFSLKEIRCRKENGQWRVAFTNITAFDGVHFGLKAHALVASLMIEHVRSVFKEVVNDVTKLSLNAADQVAEGNESSYLPKILFIKRESEVFKEPLCWTGKTPNAFKNLHHPNLQLEVINNRSFSPCFNVVSQKINTKRIGRALRTDSQGGWCAWKRLSTLQLRVYVPALIADDNSLRSRSVTVVTRQYNGSQSVIWLENKENSAVFIASTRRYDRYDTIATRVNPGYHTITVRTLRDGVFMLSGVLVGPPDFRVKNVRNDL